MKQNDYTYIYVYDLYLLEKKDSMSKYLKSDLQVIYRLVIFCVLVI